MPALTRRRAYHPHQETWLVYFGDVEVGMLGERAGIPISAEKWKWSRGFYPGLEPGQHRSGTARDLDEARERFETAWRELLPEIPPEAFETWRQARAIHRWTERMWAEGKRLPTQLASGRSTCFCGATIVVGSMEDHILAAHKDAA